MAVKSANIGQHDCQDGHFGFNLAASGSIWGAFWSHLGKPAESGNIEKPMVFIGFLRIWEVLATRFGATWRYVELC